MILSRNLSNALNDQIIAEMWSSNLYMSMSVHFTMLGMKGAASWMKKKSLQELEKAYQLVEYSVHNGGQVVIGVINSVPTAYGTPQEVFEHAAKHEDKMVGLVNKVIDITTEEKDLQTRDFLKDFLDKQVGEESAKSIVEKFKQKDDQLPEIIDQELGKM